MFSLPTPLERPCAALYQQLVSPLGWLEPRSVLGLSETTKDPPPFSFYRIPSLYSFPNPGIPWGRRLIFPSCVMISASCTIHTTEAPPPFFWFLGLAMIPRSEMNKMLKAQARQFPSPDMETLGDKHFLRCAPEACRSQCVKECRALPLQLDIGRAFQP